MIILVCNGSRTPKDDEFPFQVFTKVIKIPPFYTCGGIILTSKWILSARHCTNDLTPLVISYGSADSGRPVGEIQSKRFVYSNFDKGDDVDKGGLVLIELEEDIVFSKNASQVKLPLKNSKLMADSGKLSGWKIHGLQSGNHPTLAVIEKFKILYKDCKYPTGDSMTLGQDEFCGFDEDYPDFYDMTAMGTAVTKDGILIGLLTKIPNSPTFPLLFTKISEYENWFKNVLGDESNKLLWVSEIPNSSGNSMASSKYFSVAIFFTFLILFKSI
ncbi:chymotrypsin, putative [Pediculus humanus corporis]|uniref:Chymotrypsin, putative n=1 Tax=Pediculus humanus subsp. corporis TaxID=121224 RepID=E0VTW9_PEDHC|nr:chymotrypsin, putative [Pediculus humanus corporis]EEB16825.1 chymotrypsin, putative [Pediculus humanus corporis]